MAKNVMILVKGSQLQLGDENETLELVTEGKYSKKGTVYFVSYKESEVTGMEGTTTTLKVEDKVVTLIRTGEVNSQMVFEQGEKHMSHYDTNYGSFTIGVFANKVNVEMNDKGGEISVGYNIDIDNVERSASNFFMSIREVNKSGQYNQTN